MRAHTRLALAVVATGTVASAAGADFTTVTIERFVGEGWFDNGYLATGLATYRVYADFDSSTEDDGVITAFGTVEVTMAGSCVAGAFHNDDVFDSLTAPFDGRGMGLWTNQWDTYVTINSTTVDGDSTSISPRFAEEVNDLALDWSTENALWFVLPDDDQGLAVDGRVLLGQFSIAAGDRMALEMGLWLKDNTGAQELFAFVCPADLNHDCTVDTADLLVLIHPDNWGRACAGCIEDIDGSGVVDTGDLIALINPAAWGQTCGNGVGPTCAPEALPYDVGPCMSGCPADFTGDGIVSVQDIVFLLASWDGTGGDLDCNGVTDTLDFLILVEMWGPCP